jgi:hypothetical protein
MDYSPAEGSTSHILLLSDSVVQPSNSNSDTDVSTDTSIAATPQESGTPTGSVVVNSRDRSGTIIARPIWDRIPTPIPATVTAVPFQTITTRTRRLRHHRELPPESPSDTSRPDTETEDDGDIDMDRMEEEEEEEDDSGRMDSDVPSASVSASASPSPERSEIHQLPHRHHHHHRHHLARHATHNRGRRAVGIVSDEPTNGPQTLQVDGGDAHIIINEAGGGVGGVGGVEVGVGVGPVRFGEVGVGVEDGIVSLEPNDDFAMGAPPGAPGAIGEGLTPRGLNLEGVGRRRNRTISGVTTAPAGTTTGITGDAPDATPRAAVIGLPMMAGNNGTIRGGQQQGHQRHATIRARPAALESPTPGSGPVIPTATTAATSPTTTTTTTTHPTFPTRTSNTSASHTPPHHTASDSGPYRDEDVLLSLQLLAYLSKYPHVRQAFYKPRVTFHPASVELGGQRFGIGSGEGKEKGKKEKEKEKERKGLEKEKEKEKEKGVPQSTTTTTKETVAVSFKAFMNAASSLSSAHSNTGAASSSRGKERAQLNPSSSFTSSTLTVMAQLDPSSSTPASSTFASKTSPPSSSIPSASPRQTNVFSLVERFTFKPSSTETDLPNPPPRLPPEIQYWAGVIMRNACRKDDSRGGIRQCANSKSFLFIFSFFLVLTDLIVT